MKTSFGVCPKHTLLGFVSSPVCGVPVPSQVLRWTLSPKHLSPECDGAGVCFYFILKVVRAAEKEFKEEDIMLQLER